MYANREFIDYCMVIVIQIFLTRRVVTMFQSCFFFTKYYYFRKGKNVMHITLELFDFIDTYNI